MALAGFLLYLGTNIDNALVIMAALAGRSTARWQAALALGTAGVIVLGVSLGLAEALDDLGALPLNLLGAVPLTLGVWALLRGFDDKGVKPTAGVFALIILALSNSSDTLATLVTLLAERPDAARWPASLGYLAGLGLMAAVVGLLLGRLTGTGLARWAGTAGALVMIGFGLFILADTAGDRL